ncbi:MAG: SMC-Scp complex subunit ScpB [Dokdonella sp.]
MIEPETLKRIIEAALLAATHPLSPPQLSALFIDEEAPSTADIDVALESLRNDCETRGIELVEVASGFRFQVRQDIHPWVARLWTERPPRYSRALLETLALIAYRQPVTRAEIEQIRGVAVSTQIIRTLEEREWIRVVGQRDAPGRPELLGTTRAFLDYFNFKSLDELPPLDEIRDIDGIGNIDLINPELGLEPVGDAVGTQFSSDDFANAAQALSSATDVAKTDAGEDIVSTTTQQDEPAEAGNSSQSSNDATPKPSDSPTEFSA